MTNKECLTRLILSRSYNEKLNSICYWGKGVCKHGFSPSIKYEEGEAITDTFKIDRSIYDVMYPYCKRCEFCDRDALPAFNFRAHRKCDYSEPGDGLSDDGHDKTTSAIILFKEEN